MRLKYEPSSEPAGRKRAGVEVCLLLSTFGRGFTTSFTTLRIMT